MLSPIMPWLTTCEHTPQHSANATLLKIQSACTHTHTQEEIVTLSTKVTSHFIYTGKIQCKLHTHRSNKRHTSTVKYIRNHINIVWNFTTLWKARDSSAVQCPSSHSRWWGPVREGTPGRLVKLCSSIIAHLCLISHPSSPAPLTQPCSPRNYYPSWWPKCRNRIFCPPEMIDVDGKTK